MYLQLLLTVSILLTLTSTSPLSSSPSRFKFYPLKTPLAGPCDLEVGPDGALWGEAILANIIFRIDPSSGIVTEYPIPFTTPLSNDTTIPGLDSTNANYNTTLLRDRTAFSCAIRRGRDGNLYASNGLRNQLVRINPHTKEIRIFQPPLNPLGDLQPFNDLYSAADGIWLTQTTGNVFSFFSFHNESFVNHPIPTPLALPLGLFVASNGVVYVAEMLANKILTYDPKTAVTREFLLPEPGQLPTVIRAERKGYVYFALFTGNGIGRICMATGAIELFHTSELLGIGAEDTIDRYGGVWYSYFDVDALARLDTKTLKFSYVDFPNSLGSKTGLPGITGDLPPYIDVAVNYGPGDAVWFTDVLENRVGRYDIQGLYH